MIVALNRTRDLGRFKSLPKPTTNVFPSDPRPETPKHVYTFRENWIYADEGAVRSSGLLTHRWSTRQSGNRVLGRLRMMRRLRPHLPLAVTCGLLLLQSTVGHISDLCVSVSPDQCETATIWLSTSPLNPNRHLGGAGAVAGCGAVLGGCWINGCISCVRCARIDT